MKKILTIFALLACFTASAQHSYISSAGNVMLYSGSIERYSSPDIVVDAGYNTLRGVWVATLQIFAPGSTTNSVATWQYEYDNATIDALTATGATNTEDIKNVLMQAVIVDLVALNGAIFTAN